MKKICLLAIGSFFSALAFSQSAVQSVPGKGGHSTATQAATTTATPVLANASGVGKTKANAAKGRTATARTVATKQPSISAKPATPKAEY